MKLIKKIAAIIFILSQIISLFAEEVLNNLNTNWSIVVPGKVVTEPAITNYGFSIITDSKLLSTYSNSGILLWEKAVNRYRDASIYTIDNDFILLVTDKNSKNYAIAQNVANAFRLFTNDAYYFTDEGIPHFLIELRTDAKFNILKSRLKSTAKKIDGVQDCEIKLLKIEDRNLIGVAMLTLKNGDKIDVNF